MDMEPTNEDLPEQYRKRLEAKWPPTGNTPESVLESREPLFELYDRDGNAWTLYLDGRAEGFPEGTVIINRACPLVAFLEGQTT